MTIRDIAIAFGFEVDTNSVANVEGKIKGIKSLANKLLGTLGITLSVAGIGKLAEAAAEAKAMQSQFSQVFGELEKDADKKLKKISKNTDIEVNRMKASFSQIAAFAKTTGSSQAEALDIAERAMIAVADSAAFYDRSIEASSESLRSFLKGNYENDAALGLSCTETTRNVAANALFNKSFKDLSESQKQLTLLKMVEDANRTSGALGQASRESDEWTNQLGNMLQVIKNLTAALGTIFLKPAISAIKTFTSLLRRATSAIEKLNSENGHLTRLTERYHALVKRLQPAIERMLQSLNRGASKGRELLSKLVQKLGGMDNAIRLLAVVASALILVLNFSKVIQGATIFISLLGKMKAIFNVANLKIMGLVLIITILFLLIEDFYNFMKGNDSLLGSIFDKAGIGADNARNAIKNAWDKIVEYLKTVWKVISLAASMFFETLKNFVIKHNEEINSNFRRIWGIIKQFLEGTWTFLSQVFSKLFGQTEADAKKSNNETKNIFISVWKSILDLISAIMDALFAIISLSLNLIAATIEITFTLIKKFWSVWGNDILAYFKVCWDNSIKILKEFLSFIENVAKFITAIINGDWKAAWESLKNICKNVFSAVISLLKNFIATIKLTLKMGLSLIINLWKASWNLIFIIIKAIGKGILMAIFAIAQGILMAFIAIAKIIVNAITSLAGILSNLWGKIKDITTTTLSGVAEIISEYLNLVAEFWTGVWKSIVDFFVNLWTSFINYVENVGNTIYNIFVFVCNTLLALWVYLWNNIKELFINVWNTIIAYVENIGNSLHALFENVFNTILNIIIAILLSIIQWFVDSFNKIKEFILGILSNINDGVSSEIANIKDTIINGLELALDYIKNLPGKAFEWGKDFIVGLKNGIISGIEGVKNAVSQVGTSIRSYLHFSVPDVGPLTDYESWMPDFMKGLADGISNNKGLIIDRVKSLTEGMATLINSKGASVKTAANSIFNSIRRSVVQNVNINNSYSGTANEAERKIPSAMRKSADDATSRMARALSYARG